MPFWNEELQQWGYFDYEEVPHSEWLGIRRDSVDRMLQFFQFDHLPENLQEVSRPFCNLAKDIVDKLPSNPERTVALRKLLEAKDCAVRALLYRTE